VGGYDHSQIGNHNAVSLSVGRSVGRSVVSRNQSVGNQSVRRKERMYSGGPDVEKEESRRLDIYRKMPRH
jgi:hypothetical protein